MRINEIFKTARPAMFDSHELRISGILYKYATGEFSAKQAQAELKKFGYKADLVTNRRSNVIEVEDLKTGRLFTVEV